MDDAVLQAIRDRHAAAYEDLHSSSPDFINLRDTARDVPVLLSELEVVRAELERERESNRLLEHGTALAVEAKEAAQARLITERDEARRDRDEWKALHGSAVHEMQARLDRQERANADLRRAHDHACAERDTYRDLAKALYDHDPCSFDHHGGCQAHMFLEPEPGETCPDGRAQRLFEGGDDADGN